MKQIDFLIITIYTLFENLGFANIQTASESVGSANKKDVFVKTLHIKNLRKIANGNMSGVIAWDSG